MAPRRAVAENGIVSASRLLTREQILAALGELATGLEARGIAAELIVVGGAAMSLEHHVRATTRDIDVLSIRGGGSDVLLCQSAP